MAELDTVEDTLFVPLLGRLYATKQFPQVFYDEKALEIEKRIPDEIAKQPQQNQYTLIASATRSVNMDRAVKDFMQHNPDGIIVQLGAGLETTFFRNDNGHTVWYELDLPNVIALRQQLMGSNERDICIAADVLQDEWIRDIRAQHPSCPMLVIASGLFYYFKADDVERLLRSFDQYGPIDVVFDTVNSKGMKRMKGYMKQVGHEEAVMYFYVDDIHELAQRVGAQVVLEEPYYAHVPRKGLNLISNVSVRVSDACKMVKMEHIAFK